MNRFNRFSRLFAAAALLACLTLLPPAGALAQTCTGRFVNPLTDVCWECLFPISIGAASIGAAAGAPDTPNPASPLCYCGTPFPRIGLSVGLWEPARLIDVSRTPYCFSNLGGLSIDAGVGAARGRTGSSGGDGSSGSVWHVHYYVYPLLSWIGALLDLGCLEAGGLDIAWVSELDPTWNDEELAFLLNPEAVLFTGLPAQAACAADCTAASAGLPRDELFWCAGCQGGMNTVIGSNGTALSGGQVQRIEIAGALVHKPRILILDEATNWLDNRKQAEVMANIQRLEITRIVVAHRLSTIRRADRIYVLEAGRVVQQGAYDDLARVEGTFRELVRRQLP